MYKVLLSTLKVGDAFSLKRFSVDRYQVLAQDDETTLFAFEKNGKPIKKSMQSINASTHVYVSEA